MATKIMTPDQILAMLDSNPELASKVNEAQKGRRAEESAKVAERRSKVGLHPIPVSTLNPAYNTIAKAEYVVKYQGKAYVFTGSIVVTKKGTSSVSLTNDRKPSYVPGDITTDTEDMLNQAILKAKAAKPIGEYLKKQWDKLAAKHVYVPKVAKA